LFEALAAFFSAFALSSTSPLVNELLASLSARPFSSAASFFSFSFSLASFSFAFSASFASFAFSFTSRAFLLTSSVALAAVLFFLLLALSTRPTATATANAPTYPAVKSRTCPSGNPLTPAASSTSSDCPAAE
jgi:hypothetical protein